MMNRNRHRWTYTIKEEEGKPAPGMKMGDVWQIMGRTISGLDMPVLLRKAGLLPSDTAFSTILTQHTDVLAEVLLSRCIISHKVGTGPGCDISIYDLSQEEISAMLAMILRPLKMNVAKAALLKNDGSLQQVLAPDEIKDLMDNGWFSPEEEAAIQVQSFPGTGTGGKYSHPKQKHRKTTT